MSLSTCRTTQGETVNPFVPYLSTYTSHPRYYDAARVLARPWWWFLGVSSGQCVLVRTDGASAWLAATSDDEMVAELDVLDDLHPMPAPEPMHLQVWLRLPYTEPGALLDVNFMLAGTARLTWGAPGLRGVEYVPHGDGQCTLIDAEWPPQGAILVYGPGAPWAPAGWRP